MNFAITPLFSTVLVPSVITVVESLVQVTLVGGAPVEIQVRVNELSVLKVKVILPDSVRCPENIENKRGECQSLTYQEPNNSVTSSTVVKSNIHSLTYHYSIFY